MMGQGNGGSADKPPELNRDRVEALAAQLFETVRPVLATPPYHRDNVYVALNALAFVTGVIIAGTDSKSGWRFFIDALRGNVKEAGKLSSRMVGLG